MLPRFEHKYRLNQQEYHSLLRDCRGYLNPDSYTKAAGPRGYFVRSLYYETYDYRYYFEKITGQCNRIKPRIRVYAADERAASFVSVELKTKAGTTTTKFSEHIEISDYRRFVDTGEWSNNSDVCAEFLRQVRLNALTPTLLVDYYRRAFIGKDRSDLRLTFDTQVRYAAARELFPNRCLFRARDPHHVVMEIKTAAGAPEWLNRITRRRDVHSSPNSKYANGIEQTQGAMFF